MNLRIVRSLKQSFAGRNWLGTFAVGAGITWVAVLAGQFGLIGGIAKFLLSSLTMGFALSVMQNESNAHEDALPLLPSWSNWQNLWLSGMTAVFVNTLAATAFAFLLAQLQHLTGGGADASQALTTHAATAVDAVGGVLLVLKWLLSIGFMLLFTLLNVHYANQSRITAYLDFGTAFKRAFARPVNTVVAGLVSIAVVLAAGVVALVPVVGFAIGGFFAQVALASLWAQVYRLGR